MTDVQRVEQPLDAWFVAVSGWKRVLGHRAQNEARVVVGATSAAEAAIKAFATIASQACPAMGLDVRKLTSRASKSFIGWRVDLVVVPADHPFAREHFVANARRLPAGDIGALELERANEERETP